MFERFTERARQVVVLAQDEARALRHNYIGTEHILLGLLREEEGLAARVLESLDVALDEVRAQVARNVGQGTRSRLARSRSRRARKARSSGRSGRRLRLATTTSGQSTSCLG
jgi:ATP-dependent Clp protease ATP-binding subunit ClpA